MKTILFFSLALSAYVTTAQNLQVAFSLEEQPAIIEGMTFDSRDSLFYFGESLTKRLLRYSASGKQLDAIDAARDGMTSVLGMTVKGTDLWVCGAIRREDKDVMCVFRYNTGTLKLVHRYPDSSGAAKLFNDVTVDANGNVYVTDSYTRSIFSLDTSLSIARLFIQSDSLKDANGITTDGKFLYVSTSRGFVKVDPSTRSMVKVSFPNFLMAGYDGLYYYQNSLIGIQNVFFPVTVCRFFLNKEANAVEKAKVLAYNDPLFVIPTTGAVVGDAFYFMANNNLNMEKEVADKKLLKKVTVVRIGLK